MLACFFKRLLLHLLTLSFLVITLIPQNVTAANIVENLQNSLQGKTDYLNIINNIPKMAGTLFETNICKNEQPDIILIFDAHCHPVAQKNIFSIIDYFNSTININNIFIEGAPEGKINVSSIKNIPPEQKITQLILKDLLNKSLLSGAEFYVYSSQRDNLCGIEDFSVYINTVKQYNDLLKYQKEFSRIIKKSFKDLEKKKKYIYSKDMRLFDDVFFGNIEYNKENLQQLYSLFDKYEINLKDDYCLVYKYLKIKEYDVLKKEICYEKDFKNLLSLAQTKLPVAIYVQFINKFKKNNIEQNIVSLYNSTKQFLTQEQEQRYDYIEKLQEKLALLKNFNVKSFLEEKNILSDNLIDKIFNTDFKKDIILLTRYLKLLDNYSCMKIDSDRFNNLSKDSFCFQNILKTKNLVSNEKELLNILNNQKLKTYYVNNLKRNDIFVKNITKEKNKGKTDIVVVGGFHKEIAEELKKINIKYVSVMPNAVGKTDYNVYNKMMADSAYFYSALADTPLAVLLKEQGLNEENYKIREFVSSWIDQLKNIGLNDKQIISTIHFWAQNYIKKSETEHNVRKFVLKKNKFSIKGWLLKIVDFFKKFKTIFFFKYVKEEGDRDIDLSEKDIKKIERNIRQIPIMQIMLAAELFESFSMVFMQSSGYSLPFISTIIAVLPIVSFVVSGLGTLSKNKTPKKTLIAVSLIVHTIGTISFALSGFTGFPILLIIAQVFPTIGVAALGLALKPFLYEQLKALGKEKAFAGISGTNRSLFWFAMSISSLLGSALAAILGQVAVVTIAAIPDIIITSMTILTFLSTGKTARNGTTEVQELQEISNEKLDFNEENNEATEKKKQRTFKENLKRFFEPITILSYNKKAFSYVIINVIVNNIFFVVLGFFFQPSLELTGLNIGFFGAIYFVADIIHSISANIFKDVSFIVEKSFVRNIFFAVMAGLFALFIVTGQPLALIVIFVAMNFWQGVAELTEDSAIYGILDSNKQIRWNAFRSMFSMVIGFVSQISITGLLLLNLPNNLIVAGALGILTVGSLVISRILGKKEKSYEAREINLHVINDLLAAA
ncbi:MAG: hypothetical protein II816_00910 [Elusimicrobia bacterium]|nr:hypothetical protein [Elusimicrobiota bacterium]